MPIGELLRRGAIKNFSNGIPRILHTTWKNQKLLNFEWDLIARICRDSNENFTFCHWDDKELDIFVATFYPHLLSKYLSYPYPIQRADVGRYMLLHQFGGFYKDTNLGCNVPFDSIYYNTIHAHSLKNLVYFKVLLFSAHPRIVAADFLASTPKHPFFTHLLQNLDTPVSTLGIPYLEVMMKTGPLFLGNSIKSFVADVKVPVRAKEELAFIPKRLFEEVYFYFVDGGTWHCMDGRFLWWVHTHVLVCLLLFLTTCLFICLYCLYCIIK